MITFLVVVAFLAGVVDSIAGGGGLLTVPALLATGLSPAVVLATNKGQALFGSLTSTVAYARHGQIDRARAPWTFASAILGAIVGTRLVLFLPPETLRPLVLVLLLVVAGVALIKRPEHGHPPLAIAQKHPGLVAAVIGFGLGTYDGFFGPGTGTFLIFAFALCFGDVLVRASGNAKIPNLASNLASFALFAWYGTIRWEIAVPMGVAQLLGALVGTRIAVRRGASMVRAVAVVVSVGMAGRVAWQLIQSRL